MVDQLTDIGRGAVAIVFLFSFAIFIHELGHFMFAKLFGVYVETFSIGFGRKLWRRKWGDTEYALSAIPFGGYVKLRGIVSKELEEMLEGKDEKKGEADKEPQTHPPENVGTVGQPPLPAEAPPAEVAREQTSATSMAESVVEEMRALRARPFWQKLLVLSAGCINNFLTAIVVYFLMSWIGHYQAQPTPAVIEKVDPVLQTRVSLQAGDKIVEVAEKEVSSYWEFFDKFEAYATGKAESGKVPAVVERSGARVPLLLPVWPQPGLLKSDERIAAVGDKPVKAKTQQESVRAAYKLLSRQVGVKPEVELSIDSPQGSRKATVEPILAVGWYWPIEGALPREIPYVGMPLPNLPAEKAGIKPGDIIASVNGKPVETRTQATEMIRSLVGQTIPITVKRGDAKHGYREVALSLEVREDPEAPGRGQIGVHWGTPLTDWHQLPPHKALADAFVTGYRQSVFYVKAIGDLLSSSFQTIRENVGGPIAIGTMTYKAAQQGWTWFFDLFALFNILLAITNLLPFPVLDGGHIMFATIEGIIRRPLPAKLLAAVHYVAFIFIIGLAVLISFNDVVMNLWRLW